MRKFTSKSVRVQIRVTQKYEAFKKTSEIAIES